MTQLASRWHYFMSGGWGVGKTVGAFLALSMLSTFLVFILYDLSAEHHAPVFVWLISSICSIYGFILRPFVYSIWNSIEKYQGRKLWVSLACLFALLIVGLFTLVIVLLWFHYQEFNELLLNFSSSNNQGIK